MWRDRCFFMRCVLVLFEVPPLRRGAPEMPPEAVSTGPPRSGSFLRAVCARERADASALLFYVFSLFLFLVFYVS